MASAVGDKCIELLEKQQTEESEALKVRAKALKELVEVVKGTVNQSSSSRGIVPHDKFYHAYINASFSILTMLVLAYCHASFTMLIFINFVISGIVVVLDSIS